MLGAKPQLGRLLLPEEDKPGNGSTALLSANLWRRRFSADPHIVGKSITLNGKQTTVVGVLGPEFRLDSEVLPSEDPMDKIDIFMPLPLGADAAQRRGDENYNLVARLKPGVTTAQAQADVNAIADTQQAAIIDEKFALRFWPHGDAVGKHLWFNPKTPYTIAGVVKAVKRYGLDNEGKIAVYFPATQGPNQQMYLAVRTSSDPATLARPIIAEVHSLDPNVVVSQVQTMEELLYRSLARQRFATTMLFAFAAFALLLATVGVYGVLAYLVSQNRRQIGIRIALGADSVHVFGLVVRFGMGLAALGMLVGLLGAMLLTRVMTSLLFGVDPTDPLTFTAVILILGAAALAATIVPAARAMRVDPMVFLRQE
jgi:hypothetical protein